MRTNKERVVTNVHQESTQLKSHLKPNYQIRRLFNSPTTAGVFRAHHRAQLLAYALELRNAAATNAGQEFNQDSRPKQNKKCCGGVGSVQKRVKVWLDGMKNRWEYGPIDTQDYYSGEDDEHNGKGGGRKKLQSKFCKRVRCWLKKMSITWRMCRNGDYCCC